MKKYFTLLTLIVGLLFLPGGCIFRIKADTVLTLHDPDNDRDFHKLGFSKMVWIEEQGDISLIGYGVHPKEHKTYAFFINEPYPIFLPRYIRLYNTGRNNVEKPVYRIELLLCPEFFSHKTNRSEPSAWYLYTGKAALDANKFFNKCIFSLNDIELKSSNDGKDKIIVSGKIVAKKSTKDEFVSFHNKFSGHSGSVRK